MLSELAAACAMALVLYLTWHRSRNPFGLPVILVGGVIAAHIVFWIAGISPAEAQASGWTFQPPPRVHLHAAVDTRPKSAAIPGTRCRT